MTIVQAIILGVIQGLTEFLPVSSSGHLAIMKNILRVDLETGALYDVLLHVATLVAICIVMRKDIAKLILAFISIVRDVFTNFLIFIDRITHKDDQYYIKIMSSAYRRFVVLIIVSSIPTAIIGFLLNDIIETTPIPKQ